MYGFMIGTFIICTVLGIAGWAVDKDREDW